MDTNSQNTESPFPPQPARSSGNVGALAAAVIIVVLLAAGGFYFLYLQQQEPAETEPQETTAQSISEQDSLDVIGNDLEATQTTGAEADVSSLEQAL